MITAAKERELVLRAQSGDTEAAAELLGAHTALLRKIAGRYGRDREDALQNVYIGALEALRTFDVSRGFRFMTYAQWHCRRVAARACENDTLVRIPSKGNLAACNGRLDAAANRARKIGSFSDAVSFDSAARIGDFIADDFDQTEHVELRDEVERLRLIMKRLDDRERDILERRSRGETLEEVGVVFGLTRERIRQIESAAMKKLRKLIL